MNRQVASWLMTVGTVGMLLLATGGLSGCSGTEVSGCSSDQDCDARELCVSGECVARSGGSSGGVASCTTDNDCAPTQLCNQATNACEDRGGGTGCNATSECPEDQFCNIQNHACSPLAPGFCRRAAQCPSDKPRCNAPANGVGRCVQCQSAADCDAGQTCTTNGQCQDTNVCNDADRIACQNQGRVWNAATCFCESPATTSSTSSGNAGTTSSTSSSTGGAGTTSSTSSGGASSGGGCSTTARQQCLSAGGSWDAVTCSCSPGGGSTGGGGSCAPSQDEIQACEGQGGQVDYSSCQCIPAGGSGGGVGCDFVTLLILIFICPEIDFAQCACGPGGGGTGGTGSSSGTPSGWTCDPTYYEDGSCDCGCSVADPDCGGAGCTAPGCDDAACEYCNDATGEIACGGGGGSSSSSSGGGGGCTDTCQWANDAECDEPDLCAAGTDCSDCGGGGGTSSSSSGGGGTGQSGIGQTCTSDAECPQTSANYGPGCVDEATYSTWVGGYCTSGCDSDADCGTNAACINAGTDDFGNPVTVCLATCNVGAPTTGCRSGYGCWGYGDGTQTLGGVCMPVCTSDEECAAGTTCNATSGVCE